MATDRVESNFSVQDYWTSTTIVVLVFSIIATQSMFYQISPDLSKVMTLGDYLSFGIHYAFYLVLQFLVIFILSFVFAALINTTRAISSIAGFTGDRISKILRNATRRPRGRPSGRLLGDDLVVVPDEAPVLHYRFEAYTYWTPKNTWFVMRQILLILLAMQVLILLLHGNAGEDLGQSAAFYSVFFIVFVFTVASTINSLLSFALNGQVFVNGNAVRSFDEFVKLVPNDADQEAVLADFDSWITRRQRLPRRVLLLVTLMSAAIGGGYAFGTTEAGAHYSKLWSGKCDVATCSAKGGSADRLAKSSTIDGAKILRVVEHGVLSFDDEIENVQFINDTADIQAKFSLLYSGTEEIGAYRACLIERVRFLEFFFVPSHFGFSIQCLSIKEWHLRKKALDVVQSGFVDA